MAETTNKNDLYNSAQSNFKKLLEVAFSSEISSGQPLDDPQILQKIQEMTEAMNAPIENCYILPQLLRDCSEGNYDSVKDYIRNCCDLNEIGPDGETALTCAINANSFQIVELLLKSGANPNSIPDKIESTPLMDASNVGYADIVRVLLEFGANPDVKSSTNNTALHYAACGGHFECCKLMLDYSSNPQILIEEQNENGHTALMEAATSGFLDTTKYLVENGAQINSSSAEFKETALTLASYKGYSDIVQYLLEAGADHEHRTDEMHTALMEASMEGHIEAAKVLLFYGAHVNMRADSFESPLTLAACSGHTDLAAYLICYGADIEEVNDESYTPLMEASREGHLDTVAMLLSLGANINRITEETQETAMTLAACGGFHEIVLLLHRCGADIELGSSTPLMESSQEGHLEIVKALLMMGAKVDAKNSTDETSLHFAAENGHAEVCRYLLDHNADIHHVSEGGKTCLMKACRAGNLDVVFLLVDRGSRIDQMTNIGDHNSLSFACANGHCKVVEYLLQVGADPTVKLKDNSTVLIEASRAGHIDVIEILLRDNKRDKRLLLTTQNQTQHVYPIGSIDSDMINNSVRELSSHYIPTSTVIPTTVMNDSQDMYGMDKLINISLGMRVQQPTSSSICDYSTMTNIYNEHHFPGDTKQLSLHSCAFSNSVNSSSKIFTDELFTNENMTFSQSSVLSADIYTPINSISTSLNINQNGILPEQGNLPLSIFGPENDKLLQNMLEPNLEEWVKYMCPNFNNNMYVTDSKLSQPELSCVTSPQLLHQNQLNSHFHRKIKKAKHSENYNSQFDLTTPNNNCVHLCQRRLTNNFFAEKSANLELDHSIPCKFHRCPAEGAADCPVDVKLLSNHHSVVMDDITENENDINHDCKDCSKLLQNTQKDNFQNAFNYPVKKNLFSSSNNLTSIKQLSPSCTSSLDSGVFSIDKNLVNVPLTALLQDEYQADMKRIFNSVTQTNNSPLKSKISNPVLSSTPFQKQVLQPKRRLQQNQRSPISNTSSLSTSSSFYSDHKTSPHQIKLSPQSHPFILPSSTGNGSLFDIAESNVGYNNFNFPEKNLSTDERDLFFQQSFLSDFRTDHTSIPLQICPLAGDCNNKHGLLTPNYNIDVKSSNDINGNCDNLPNRKSSTMTINSNENKDNLEVVEEIENEDNDEDEDPNFESDVEITDCTPPYHSKAKCCNRICCKKKLNVNVCTESLQESPLSLACSGGHIEVVKLLINSGAKLEHRDKKSQTALHVTVINGHLEVMKLLLDSGADIEAIVDRTKDTALSMACANGKLDLVEELVRKGANIEHRNVSDYTPLSLAASGGFVDIIKFLLKNNSEINSRTNSKLGISPLMLAAMNGHYEAVNVLLENGSDINAQIETNRNTALTLACFQGRVDVVRLLVDKKAYIEHRAKSGLTPLMEAASQGHVDVGRILIEAGADVNASPVPTSRETALIIASEKGHTDFVRLLLYHNAIVDCRNKKGDTPLWLACNGGYIEVVKILIEAMSDPNSADNRRMTCLMAAFKKGHKKVVKELLRYVTQFPSEHDCIKHMKSIKNEDKDLIKRCEECKDIILKAKERQEYEAAKNAKDLLKQVEEERKAKEQKEVKQAKKREKKKAKKKAKQDDKDVEIPICVDKKIGEESKSHKIENQIVKSVTSSQETELMLPNICKSIIPDNCLPVKSKRLRSKPESERNKKDIIEEIKSDNCVNDVVVTISKEDIQSVYLVDQDLTNQSEVMLVDGNDQIKNKCIAKNNSWIQINSNKILFGNKVEENTTSNSWQKIGGSKKKLDIQVNKKDIGKVIGQGGSVVNAIRHITGAHIDIDSMANDIDERTVHIKGTLEAVSKAKDYICDLVDSNITGSAVIKESEPYISKANIASKSSIDYAVTEADYLKSIHTKPLSIVRQNGKVNKFGYSKFALSSSTSNNLQYGFSKPVKTSDFATVAAAGIVSVSSPIYPAQRLKYSDNLSTNDNFPSLSEAHLDYPTNQSLIKLSSVNTNSHFSYNSQQSNYINEPLEVNTTISQSSVGQNNMLKSFPLAPGSERSLHQRTYNSTPEHSPQIDNNSKNEVTSSGSTISDRDESADANNINVTNTNVIYIPPVNTAAGNSWLSNDYGKPFQDPANFCDPVSIVDFEVLNRYPKLQSLNPKAEAFSPSFATNSNNVYNLKPEDFYYNINGTLTLNPTANIFKPRQQQNFCNSASVSVINPIKSPANVDHNNKKNNIIYTTSTVVPPPPTEERLIRLHDHINMAINIFLRTNGYDHNMAEAAFSSFMRSANLDLNTRLTTTEFTSLINNIINQSNTPSSQPPQATPPLGFLPQPPPSYDENISRLLSTQNQSQFRLINQPLTTTQTHWPSMITNFNSQSIWAPGSNNGGVMGPTPFFPNLNQCVSAQAAFNSPLSVSISNESSSSYLPTQPSQSLPSSYDNTVNGSHKLMDCVAFKSALLDGSPIPASQTQSLDHNSFDQKEV